MHSITRRSASAFLPSLILALAWILLPVLRPWRPNASDTPTVASDPARQARPRLDPATTTAAYNTAATIQTAATDVDDVARVVSATGLPLDLTIDSTTFFLAQKLGSSLTRSPVENLLALF